MKKYQQNQDKNSLTTGFTGKSPHKFGRTELYMLLLLLFAGITVDTWFNRHQLPWQSSENHIGSAMSNDKTHSFYAPSSNN